MKRLAALEDGSELWTRQYGTSGVEQWGVVAVDRAGSIYVGGITTGTFPGQTSAGGRDAFIAKLSADPPEVQSIVVAPDESSLTIQLNDVDLVPSLAENTDNYRLVVGAGDADADGDGDPFNDGDETELTITSVEYDAAADQITIHAAETLVGDFVRLEIDGDDATTDGTPGVTDAAGTPLNGDGDFVQVLNLNRPVVQNVDVGQDLENLTGKLQGAARALGADVDGDAGLIAILEAFKLGVDNWFSLGEITLEEHDELIAAADLILPGIELTSA